MSNSFCGSVHTQRGNQTDTGPGGQVFRHGELVGVESGAHCISHLQKYFIDTVGRLRPGRRIYLPLSQDLDRTTGEKVKVFS